MDIIDWIKDKLIFWYDEILTFILNKNLFGISDRKIEKIYVDPIIHNLGTWISESWDIPNDPDMDMVLFEGWPKDLPFDKEFLHRKTNALMILTVKKKLLTEDQKEHVLHNLWVDVHKWYDKYNCTHDVNYSWNDFLEYYNIEWTSLKDRHGNDEDCLVFVRKGADVNKNVGYFC